MTATQKQIDTVARHFVIAAIWADCPEGTNPRAPKETQQTARDICAAFIADNLPLFHAAMNNPDYGWYQGERRPESSFGHDLFLTMAGHGAGFWDRDALAEDGTGEKLSDECRKYYLETDFYRGWLYFSGGTKR